MTRGSAPALAALPRSVWPLALAVPALALLGLCAVIDVGAAFRALHVGVLAFGLVPAGALALLMAADLTGGDWRRLLHAPLVALLPLLVPTAILFLSLTAGLGRLFPWASPDLALTGFKADWFAAEFFTLRTGLAFALWLVLAVLITRSGRPQPVAAGIGLILLGLSISMVAIDWAMSVDLELDSSIFPLIVAGHAILGALAVAVAVLCLAGDPGLRVKPLGALLVTALMVWGYMHFMQYLVFWAGNLPHEAGWYLARRAGAWLWLTVVLFGLGGAVPFVLLCLPEVRRGRRALGLTAVLILAARPLDAAWLLLPGRLPAAPELDVAAVTAGVLAVGLLLFTLWLVPLRRGARRHPGRALLRYGDRWTRPVPNRA